MSEVFGRVVTTSSLPLPALVVLVPLIGAALVLALGRYERWRDTVAVATTTLTFLLVASIYPLAIARGHSISFNLPKYVFGIGMNFSVDPLSFVFALITSLVWLVATVYSVGYMSHEQKRTRYYFFLLIVLASNLGVVVTGDLFSLFIFFEALGLFSYPLVIHSETDEALKAGTKYMLMNLIGGAALLAGILLLYHFSGSFKIVPALEAMSTLGTVKYLVAALLIGGFGVKAGFVPLHIWLPDAHPVAPSPASALLSGIMIKAGAYGIIRTAAVIFRPPIVSAKAELAAGVKEALIWHPTTLIGYYVIWIGISTMLIAAIMALLQDNGKRLLAYSSVSQMGYIIMGIGAGTYMAAEGSMGLSGAIFHIINHALYKSTLFLAIGAVYFVTHELSISNLGGLYRKLPLVTVVALIAAGGIMGVPLLNGYASKSLLFEGIKIAAEHSSGPIPLIYAQWLYLLVSALTTAYVLKFIINVFFGELPRKYEDIHPAPMFMNAALAVMGAMIVAVGFFPNLILRSLVIPVSSYWNLPVTELTDIHFFTPAGLEEATAVIAAGVVIFLLGARYRYFMAKFPDWFSIDYVYQLAARQVYVLAGALDWLNNAYEAAFMKIVPGFMRLKKPVGRINELLSRVIFALFVDMWLFRPVTASLAESILAHGMVKNEDEKKKLSTDLERLAEAVSKSAGTASKLSAGKLEQVDYRLVDDVAYFGQKMSLIVGGLDLDVIDRLISLVALIGERLSTLAGLIDTYVIDGLVNGVGWVAQKSGRRLRPLQSGDVQGYGLVMVGGAVIIIFVFALAFYGVFRLR